MSWLGVLLFFRHGCLFEFEVVTDESGGSGEGRCEKDDEEVGWKEERGDVNESKKVKRRGRMEKDDVGWGMEKRCARRESGGKEEGREKREERRGRKKGGKRGEGVQEGLLQRSKSVLLLTKLTAQRTNFENSNKMNSQ